MIRKIIYAVLALTVGALVLAWVNRDALVDRAIQARLQQEPDRNFLEDKEHVRVLVCGTGSPEVSSAKAQACTLVSAGGKMFLFDVGDGAVRSLAHSKIQVNELERVFITHFHSDHFNDLAALINAGWIWGRKAPLEVQGPVGTKQVLDGFAQAYALDEGYRSANMPHLAKNRMVAFGVPLEIAFAEEQRSLRVYDKDGVTIDATLVAHDPVKPALGYVLKYKGKKVFVSGDTEVSPVNMDAMRDADLAVHESYAAHMVRRAIPQMKKLGMDFEATVAERTIPYHADNIALAKQAQEAGVKHLLLTHLIPYPDSFVVRQMYTEGMGQHYQGKLTVAKDGLILVL
ncbi:MBL fold metallo-hydrolase [Sphingorhabdus pulchriflava]|uniref:MBL fold metallo-hydrolase n=1 Tax=Sphingorhabdus pulchriflava TaxID=2292257 RepID=A0A371B1W1_9SPHN|nr:MBL fold metallo-hydrolase [Sphingorhabdus pulchriflava]RDV01441.1 MBL fold metallo-hydrolase [Sphingorhabdus pulchriflava]